MSRIAILDTGIEPSRLHCKSFVSYKICSDVEDGGDARSHGTVCAFVLDYFASDYDLVSIQVMPHTCEEGHGKPMGSIGHLREGLLLCAELGADIVCMSAVSSILSDSAYLYDEVKELSRRSILVSALDNRRFMTIPTGYPFVVGVQADRKNLLSPGEVAYRERDAFCANLYANCDIELLRHLGYAPSNSFAVPVAAARMNDWINRGEDIEKVFRRMRRYPERSGQEDVRPWEGGLRRDIPLILMSGTDDGQVYRVCRAAMDELYRSFQVQAAAICSMEGDYDIRFRMAASAEGMCRELLFMEYHYKTDLIFLAVGEKEREAAAGRIPADVEILVCGDSAQLLYEGGRMEGSVRCIAEWLCEILQ